MQIIDKFKMFNIAVTDADEAKKFYADKLGFKVTDNTEHGGQRWISMNFPGNEISIILSNVHENMKPGTLKLYFSSPDVEAAQKELEEKGIKAVKAGNDWAKWDSPDGKGQKWFEITDPDGNHILIISSSYRHKSK